MEDLVLRTIISLEAHINWRRMGRQIILFSRNLLQVRWSKGRISFVRVKTLWHRLWTPITLPNIITTERVLLRREWSGRTYLCLAPVLANAMFENSFDYAIDGFFCEIGWVLKVFIVSIFVFLEVISLMFFNFMKLVWVWMRTNWNFIFPFDEAIEFFFVDIEVWFFNWAPLVVVFLWFWLWVLVNHFCYYYNY